MPSKDTKRARAGPTTCCRRTSTSTTAGRWHAPRGGRYVDTIDPANRISRSRASRTPTRQDAGAAVAGRAAARSRRGARCTPLERAARCARRRRSCASNARSARDARRAEHRQSGGADGAPTRTIAATGIDYFAGLVTELKGDTIPMGDGHRSTTRFASRWAWCAHRRVQPSADVRRGEDRRAARGRQHDRRQAAEQAPLSALQDGRADRRRVSAGRAQRACAAAGSAGRRCRRIRWCGRSR